MQKIELGSLVVDKDQAQRVRVLADQVGLPDDPVVINKWATQYAHAAILAAVSFDPTLRLARQGTAIDLNVSPRKNLFWGRFLERHAEDEQDREHLLPQDEVAGWAERLVAVYNNHHALLNLVAGAATMYEMLVAARADSSGAAQMWLKRAEPWRRLHKLGPGQITLSPADLGPALADKPSRSLVVIDVEHADTGASSCRSFPDTPEGWQAAWECFTGWVADAEAEGNKSQPIETHVKAKVFGTANGHVQDIGDGHIQIMRSVT